jgi:hypothetical protein
MTQVKSKTRGIQCSLQERQQAYCFLQAPLGVEKSGGHGLNLCPFRKKAIMEQSRRRESDGKEREDLYTL